MRSRLAESVEAALQAANGIMLVLAQNPDGKTDAESGTTEHFFSQKNACPDC
jgi:excinuclease ABC subunit A